MNDCEVAIRFYYNCKRILHKSQFRFDTLGPGSTKLQNPSQATKRFSFALFCDLFFINSVRLKCFQNNACIAFWIDLKDAIGFDKRICYVQNKMKNCGRKSRKFVWRNLFPAYPKEMSKTIKWMVTKALLYLFLLYLCFILYLFH